MKKTFFALAIAAFIYAGCGNNQSTEATHDHGNGTHVHEDGTVHEDHGATQQEEFNTGDTSQMMNDTAHHHEPGSDHTH